MEFQKFPCGPGNGGRKGSSDRAQAFGTISGRTQLSIMKAIKPIRFPVRPGGESYNASEVVALGDGRFLFCDNNINDALFELRLTPEGGMSSPLVARPISGIRPEVVDDLESMALVEEGDRRYIIVSSSLSLKQRKRREKKRNRRGKTAPARDIIVRITLGKDENLEAEIIPGFRYWLIDNAPTVAKYAKYLPDDGGLNVEGLGWDPRDGTLMFGVRTPVIDGKPVILRVKTREIGGLWNLNNFEMLSPVTLDIDVTSGEQGIRTVEYDPSREAFLIVTGNSTSSSKAPFALYSWDGNPEGAVHRFRGVRFGKGMKVEGVTHGDVGGKGAVLFVDDGGGFQFLWDTDPRLRI